MSTECTGPEAGLPISTLARALARGQPPDPEEYALVSVGAKGV